jgi:hypothetical protein
MLDTCSDVGIHLEEEGETHSSGAGGVALSTQPSHVTCCAWSSHTLSLIVPNLQWKLLK